MQKLSDLNLATLSLHSRSTVHHHHQSISKAKATGSIQNKKRFHSSIRLHQHHQHQHLLKRRWKESSSEKSARMIITLQHNKAQSHWALSLSLSSGNGQPTETSTATAAAATVKTADPATLNEPHYDDELQSPSIVRQQLTHNQSECCAVLYDTLRCAQKLKWLWQWQQYSSVQQSLENSLQLASAISTIERNELTKKKKYFLVCTGHCGSHVIITVITTTSTSNS